MKANPVRVRGSLTQETLGMMQDLIAKWSKHPFFVQLARQIASKAGAKNPVDESRAVHAWIRANVEYRADPWETQWVQDPFETAVKSKAGNCVNQAILAGTLLQALGHPIKATAVKWENRDDFSHAVIRDGRLQGAVIDTVSPDFSPWPPFGAGTAALMEAY